MNVQPKKTNLGNLLLLIASLIIGLFLVEIVLRQIKPLDVGKSSYFRIPHSVLGWVLEPGASYLYQLKEATVRVTHNSQGWRDIEHTLENPLKTYRIVVLGDSYMEAYSVKLQDAFHRQIKGYFKKKNREIEIINLGVGGYGTLQEYLAYMEVGQFYRPNLVLLGFYPGNDIQNNSEALESILNQRKKLKTKARPYLDPTELTEWKISAVDFQASQQRFDFVKRSQNSFLGKLKQQSALVRDVVRQKKRLLKTLFPVKRHEKLIAIRYGEHACSEQLEYAKSWKTTKRILARLKDEIKNRGSQLVVFSVPALHEVHKDRMKAIRKKMANPETLCLEEAPAYERLEKTLGELSIDYVNLLPGFRRMMRDRRINLFRLSDEHWNPEGHALATEIVGTFLIDKEYVLEKALE